jgi:dolichol-phosphate mannosyltransferase
MAPKESSKVSVVLPSYNEQDNIQEAISRITKAVGEKLHEIIVVDDNSPDGTWKIVEDLHRSDVRLIRRLNEKGLASALADGIKAAKGDVIVWMDCDLGLSPEEIPNLVNKIEQGYDVAIASRYVKGGKDPRPPLRVFLSWMINGFAILFLGSAVKDYTSGFSAVKREVFDKISFSRKGFGEYFIDFAYHAQKQKMKIIEIPCAYQIRTGGVSKSDGTLGTLFKLGWDYGIRVLSLRFGKQQKRGPPQAK